VQLPHQGESESRGSTGDCHATLKEGVGSHSF
jgi:hypothetical protein